MALPLYKDCHPIKSADSHAGLWYDRFFDKYDNNWQVPKDASGKLAWIKTVEGTVGGPAVTILAMRQMNLVKALGGKTMCSKTDWHFATGLGNNHPVENGFAWHPTLGVPYLTGAAVKGLLRAWCEQWSSEFKGLADAKKAEKLRDWFGPSFKELKDKTNKIEPATGNLIFFDAIPTKPVQLQADVMTPHYGDWYEEGGNAPKTNGSNVPADWHNPVPVPFLAVAPGQSFLFSVAARPGCIIDLDGVLKEFKDALEYLGAGAKTAAGYGHMIKDDEQLKIWEDRVQKEKDKEKRRVDEEASRLVEEEALIQMTPLEREMHGIINANSNRDQKDYVLLLQVLESGKWDDANMKVQVAQKIKGMMQTNNVWKETGDPKKSKEHKRTLAIMKYLNQ